MLHMGEWTMVEHDHQRTMS